jgi:hypothetical protein
MDLAGRKWRRCIGQVLLDRVVETEPPLVAQPHDRHSDEGLRQ